MQKINEGLEAVADLADKNSDLSKIQSVISSVRSSIKNFVSKTDSPIVGAIPASPAGRHELPLQKLDTELSIWQSKLTMILSEPAGRKGIAKHARFWAEKLRAIHV